MALSLGVASDAAAAKVYKWVDQDGNVHFGDRPSNDEAQEMEIKTRPPEAVPEANRATGAGAYNPNRTSISDLMEEERLRRKQAREQKIQARLERERNCALARDRLRSYKESNYLYDVDNSGKRRILSDAERSAAEQSARAEIKRHCG